MECKHLPTVEIRKGDSTDFFYSITIPIEVEEGSTVDLTGWKAIFKVDSYTETFEDITSRELYINLTAENTKELKIGDNTAYVKFITSDNKVGTSKPLFIVRVLGEVING